MDPGNRTDRAARDRDLARLTARKITSGCDCNILLCQIDLGQCGVWRFGAHKHGEIG